MSTPRNEENLSGLVKIVVVVMIVCLGLWGCARKPSTSVSGQRVQALESRCQKLEQEYRQVAAARDRARTDLARLQQEAADRTALQQERDQLLGQYKASQAEREQIHKLLSQRTTERDDLRQQAAQRAAERDAVLGRCEKIRKGLQQLIGDDEHPATSAGPVSPTPPAISSATLGAGS